METLTGSDLLLESFVHEVGRHWPIERELLALMVELQHATWRALLGAFGGKNMEVPPPLVIPRPGRQGGADTRMTDKPKVGFRALLAHLKKE